MTILTITAAAALLALAWWWFVARNRPTFPPLALDADDPLLAEARRKAKASIERFRSLYQANPKAAKVKIPFRTSSGEVEFLWAEVESWAGDSLKLLYMTPPVSHQGYLERRQSHAIADIDDWIVELPSGHYAGGFSMQVMFIRGREQWGRLPPELEAESARYADT